jgi:hypothetical protein
MPQPDSQPNHDSTPLAAADPTHGDGVPVDKAQPPSQPPAIDDDDDDDDDDDQGITLQELFNITSPDGISPGYLNDGIYITRDGRITEDP